jgi:formate dehydrogenase beta subunit
MSRLTRRDFLGRALTAGAGLTGLAATAASASTGPSASSGGGHMGMLYDATKCVGCKACVASCKRVNDLPPDKGAFDSLGLWDAPMDLDGQTRNIVKLYKESDKKWSFVKMQCMHCAKPSCVSVCPVTAMQQDEKGTVFYDKKKCIGCRYCQVACPFSVPRFQWNTATPQIVKCDLCKFSNMRNRGLPACADTCPTHAVIYGSRAELLAEAKRRIEAAPDRYVHQVYGEQEVGGTNVIYLAAVPFEKLGLRPMPKESPAAFSEKIHHTIYKGFVAPVALYGGLFLAAFWNRKRLEKTQEGQAEREDQP